MVRGRLVLGVLLALGASSAIAVESCESNGRSINLNNGATTANLTGLVRCTEDGRVTREIPYVDGKVEGTEKRYGSMLAPDKITETQYRRGERHGLTRVFEKSGRLESETEYRDGRELGVSRTFHPNGKVRREVERTGEELTSFVHEYDVEGRLVAVSCGVSASRPIGRGECRYRAYTGVLRTVHPDGSPKDVLPMKEGLIDGVAETFAPGGRIARREPMRGGLLHGVAVIFRESGDVLEDATFASGILDGPARRFHATARIAVEWRYAQGVLLAERVRYQNGELRSETSRGEGRIEARGYWDNGKPRFIGTFVETNAPRPDTRAQLVFASPRIRDLERLTEWGATGLWPSRLAGTGVHRTFYESGAPESEVTLVNGRREGPFRGWYEKGQLAVEGTNANGRITARKTWDEAGKLTADEAYFEDGSRKKQ